MVLNKTVWNKEHRVDELIGEQIYRKREKLDIKINTTIEKVIIKNKQTRLYTVQFYITDCCVRLGAVHRTTGKETTDVFEIYERIQK